jgi:hypothetical protein
VPGPAAVPGYAKEQDAVGETTTTCRFSEDLSSGTPLTWSFSNFFIEFSSDSSHRSFHFLGRFPTAQYAPRASGYAARRRIRC